jgi:hypothetical protein
MQQACQTLADTGANIAPYIAIAFGLLTLSALTFYFIYSGRRLNKGFFSLLLVFGLVGSFILIPTKSLAASPNCTPAGQTAGAGATTPTPTPTPVPPLTCPTGFVVVPGNPAYNTTDFCVMKYTAKNSGGTVASSNDINGDGSFLSNTYTGGTAVSTATDQPWTNISQTDAITASQTAGTGAHLLTENEWMTIAHNILLQPANWCDADGSSETVAGGGAALEFYCSQRFRTSAQKQIINPKLKITTGVNVKITNKKNRFFRPHAAAEGIQLLFDRGINPLSGLLEVLIQAERIEAASGQGRYTVKPEFLPEGRESFIFTAKKTSGDVPRELVLTCPKIIDALTAEQVEEYLAPFANFDKLEEEGIIEEAALASMLTDEGD